MGNKFGDYILQLRKDRNLTLRDVEKQVKISNAYLSQVERGERGIPTMRILSRLAEVYGVPVSVLTEKAEEMFKPKKTDKNKEAMPSPDADFICRVYERLSEDNKQMLKRFLTTLENEDKSKSWDLILKRCETMSDNQKNNLSNAMKLSWANRKKCKANE